MDKLADGVLNFSGRSLPIFVWRTALLGMRDEALDAGAEALDATRELGGKVRTDIEDRRYKRLSKRFDRMSQKRSEREHIEAQTEGLEE